MLNKIGMSFTDIGEKPDEMAILLFSVKYKANFY